MNMLSKYQIHEYLNTFGVNLRRYRNNLNMSYDNVEAKTGISKSILSRIENAQTAPSFETFLRLYVFLGVTSDFFKSNSSVISDNSNDNPVIAPIGLKFERKNFVGGSAVNAEIEIFEPGVTINLQARRSSEESLILLSGSLTISYASNDSTEIVSGEIYTLPPNRQRYKIYSDTGAKALRVSVPFSKDQSSTYRYRMVVRKNRKSKN